MERNGSFKHFKKKYIEKAAIEFPELLSKQEEPKNLSINFNQNSIYAADTPRNIGNKNVKPRRERQKIFLQFDLDLGSDVESSTDSESESDHQYSANVSHYHRNLLPEKKTRSEKLATGVAQYVFHPMSRNEIYPRTHEVRELCNGGQNQSEVNQRKTKFIYNATVEKDNISHTYVKKNKSSPPTKSYKGTSGRVAVAPSPHSSIVEINEYQSTKDNLSFSSCFQNMKHENNRSNLTLNVINDHSNKIKPPFNNNSSPDESFPNTTIKGSAFKRPQPPPRRRRTSSSTESKSLLKRPYKKHNSRSLRSRSKSSFSDQESTCKKSSYKRRSNALSSSSSSDESEPSSSQQASGPDHFHARRFASITTHEAFRKPDHTLYLENFAANFKYFKKAAFPIIPSSSSNNEDSYVNVARNSLYAKSYWNCESSSDVQSEDEYINAQKNVTILEHGKIHGPVEIRRVNVKKKSIRKSIQRSESESEVPAKTILDVSNRKRHSSCKSGFTFEKNDSQRIPSKRIYTQDMYNSAEKSKFLCTGEVLQSAESVYKNVRATLSDKFAGKWMMGYSRIPRNLMDKFPCISHISVETNVHKMNQDNQKPSQTNTTIGATSQNPGTDDFPVKKPRLCDEFLITFEESKPTSLDTKNSENSSELKRKTPRKSITSPKYNLDTVKMNQLTFISTMETDQNPETRDCSNYCTPVKKARRSNEFQNIHLDPKPIAPYVVDSKNSSELKRKTPRKSPSISPKPNMGDVLLGMIQDRLVPKSDRRKPQFLYTALNYFGREPKYVFMVSCNSKKDTVSLKSLSLRPIMDLRTLNYFSIYWETVANRNNNFIIILNWSFRYIFFRVLPLETMLDINDHIKNAKIRSYNRNRIKELGQDGVAGFFRILDNFPWVTFEFKRKIFGCHICEEWTPSDGKSILEEVRDHNDTIQHMLKYIEYQDVQELLNPHTCQKLEIGNKEYLYMSEYTERYLYRLISLYNFRFKNPYRKLQDVTYYSIYFHMCSRTVAVNYLTSGLQMSQLIVPLRWEDSDTIDCNAVLRKLSLDPKLCINSHMHGCHLINKETKCKQCRTSVINVKLDLGDAPPSIPSLITIFMNSSLFGKFTEIGRIIFNIYHTYSNSFQKSYFNVLEEFNFSSFLLILNRSQEITKICRQIYNSNRCAHCFRVINFDFTLEYHHIICIDLMVYLVGFNNMHTFSLDITPDLCHTIEKLDAYLRKHKDTLSPDAYELLCLLLTYILANINELNYLSFMKHFTQLQYVLQLSSKDIDYITSFFAHYRRFIHYPNKDHFIRDLMMFAHDALETKNNIRGFQDYFKLLPSTKYAKIHIFYKILKLTPSASSLNIISMWEMDYYFSKVKHLVNDDDFPSLWKIILSNRFSFDSKSCIKGIREFAAKTKITSTKELLNIFYYQP